MEGWRDGGMEGWRDGGMEGGREGRERERERREGEEERKGIPANTENHYVAIVRLLEGTVVVVVELGGGLFSGTLTKTKS